jgi:hypothetical protein
VNQGSTQHMQRHLHSTKGLDFDLNVNQRLNPGPWFAFLILLNWFIGKLFLSPYFFSYVPILPFFIVFGWNVNRSNFLVIKRLRKEIKTYALRMLEIKVKEQEAKIKK